MYQKVNKVIYLIICFSLCLSLNGCLATLKAYPERSYNTKKELEAMKDYLSETAITKYDAVADTQRNNMSKRDWRNSVVNARVRAIDLHFNDFQQNLFQEGVGYGIATDWIILALSGAGALMEGASTALSAASTGVVGAKASFDKNAFFDKTMPTLLATMTAQRKAILVNIREGLNKDINEYSLNLALNDLDSYYNAGTIPGALIEISEASGAKAKKADELLKTNLVIRPVPSDLQERRKAAANFIRSLDPTKAEDKTKLETLAEALGLSTDGNLSLKIRLKISAAQSEESFNIIAQKLQILFREDI